MQLKIKIAGIDVSNSVLAHSLIIESVITKSIDTCNLTIEDTTGSINITEWDEIIVSNTAESVRYFAGYIADVFRLHEGLKKVFRCMAQDYTLLPTRVLVNKIYDDKTDLQIIQDLFAIYLAEIDTATYVQTGATNEHLVFNRTTLRQALDQLATNSGFDWYIDYNKKLHYFSTDATPAPFALSDAPDNITTYPYGDFKYEKDASYIVNRITVVGSYYLSSDASFEAAGNAQSTEFLLPYKLHPPIGYSQIRVYKNTGTDVTPIWTEQTVGIDHIDTMPAKDCLYNADEKLLKFNTAPPLLKRAAKVTGQYEVPVLVRRRSDASYTAYGRWLEDKLVDKDIDNLEWAKMRAKGFLAQHAFAKVRGSLVCWQDGLGAGQTVRIINARHSVDDYYLIQKLTMRLLGGTTVEYAIEFGKYNPDLVDLLISLKAKAAQYQETRDDEVLTELLEQMESLALTEATDYHTDAFPPDISRWIAIPPTQSVGHHIRHEKLVLAETTPGATAHVKNNYLWDAADTRWDFFSWG